MKRLIYVLVVPLLVAGGLVFANRPIDHEPSRDSIPKPIPAAARKAAMEQWLATPEGKKFRQWETSAAGQKVYASEDKIRADIKALAPMEAVVTDLSLPPGSRLGFGVMVRIKGEAYILSFGLEGAEELQQLHSLKVGDKILVKSHSVSHAPKYAYPILSGDYVQRDGKRLYQRVPRKGGC